MSLSAVQWAVLTTAPVVNVVLSCCLERILGVVHMLIHVRSLCSEWQYAVMAGACVCAHAWSGSCHNDGELPHWKVP